MTLRLFFAFAVLIFGLATAVSSLAHHSQSEFDFRTTVEVEGTVTNLEWKSPHAWLYVDVVSVTGAPARNHPGIAIARTVRDADGNGVFTGITDVN